MKDRLAFKQYLYDKCQEVIATREQYPIIKEFKNKNCTVRRRPMNGTVDLFIVERVDYGITPEPFVEMQKDVRDFLSANKMCMNVDMLEQITSGPLEGVQIYAMYIKSPSFLVADRLFIDAKYLWCEENLVIVSS
jgi:hypothetical protein